MPGLFTPCERDGRLLVDGSLVNPVPILAVPRDGRRIRDREWT
jgi:predicted acylesterase/phospholipase RssA